MNRAAPHLRAACAGLIAAALLYAPFAPADAQMIAVSNCNGGMSLLVIPSDDTAPGDQRRSDCAKACHAMCERKNKGVGRK